MKVRLTKGCTVRGIVYPRNVVIEVPNYIAERMEKRGLGEPLVSGLILPPSVRKSKKGKPKKRQRDHEGD